MNGQNKTKWPWRPIDSYASWRIERKMQKMKHLREMSDTSEPICVTIDSKERAEDSRRDSQRHNGWKLPQIYEKQPPTHPGISNNWIPSGINANRSTNTRYCTNAESQRQAEKPQKQQEDKSLLTRGLVRRPIWPTAETEEARPQWVICKHISSSPRKTLSIETPLTQQSSPSKMKAG